MYTYFVLIVIIVCSHNHFLYSTRMYFFYFHKLKENSLLTSQQEHIKQVANQCQTLPVKLTVITPS